MHKLQISIPEPCHQNWHQMTPTEQGRFCNACAKEVIDFSMMTDTEVLNYFTNITHEKVCGRALPGQLNRTICRPKEPTKRLFRYWNYMVMCFMFFAKGNTVKAQGNVRSATECNPLKTNDNIVQMAATGGIKRVSRQVINGIVKDEFGNPAAFASIMIKGLKTGVGADGKGEFKINAESTGILVVSGTGYKTVEIPVGDKKELNIILEKQNNTMLGGFSIVTYNGNGELIIPNNQSLAATITIKDLETAAGLKKATILINKNFAKDTDTVFSDDKGNYTLKGIRTGDTYQVRIGATGYETNEFTIDANDFRDRKKDWEVFLRKQKTATAAATENSSPLNEKPVRLGGINVIKAETIPLYVVDGVIRPAVPAVMPEEIASTLILKSADAMALFGSAGSNGAIVITTKKPEFTNLDTVTVTANGKTTRKLVCTTETSVMGSMVSGVSISNAVTDTLKQVTAKIIGSVKIYPNPVQRGNTCSIALNLKQTGSYRLQLTDATGRTVLQKQITATVKTLTEKILAEEQWSSGVYYISITNESGQLMNKISFIVN